MKSIRFPITAIAASLIACMFVLPPTPGLAQNPDEGEILTRGPLHEAFAGTIEYNPEAGLVIAAQPPEPIEELPPELAPEGDNVTWISGYWAWDDERKDFLWVSGIWRNVPPDREWVPGYWNEVGGQYQWISGYWAEAETREVTYLPPPPAAVESGPNIDPPSGDDTWIPGVWVWAENRYLWRPGYWEPLREDWTYVPDYYRWTPRGCIFVSGYWDHDVSRRGVVFAPVYFHGGIYRRPGFFYSPATVISISLFTDHLFVRPSYCHYYYGDFYEPHYREIGFFASFSYHSGRRGYDPIYAHRRWHNRHDKGWERRHREDFDYCRDHRDSRPPRTWESSRAMADGRRGGKGPRGDYEVAAPIGNYEKGERQFHKIDPKSRDRILAQRKDLSDFGKERRLREAKPGVGRGKPGEGESKPSKESVSRSPILGRKSAEMSKEAAPPKRRQTPEASAGRIAAREASEARGKPSDPKREKGSIGQNEPIGPQKRGGQPSQPKTQPKPETRSQPSQPKSQPRPETRSQPSQPKSQPRPETRSQPSQPKSQPRPETRSQPSQPKSQPRPETRSQPSQPKSQPRPETRSQPSQPKSQPRPETRSQPSQPKSQPRPETRSQPSQPKSQPRPETRSQPSQPKSQPRPETRSQPSQPKRGGNPDEGDDKKGKKK